MNFFWRIVLVVPGEHVQKCADFTILESSFTFLSLPAIVDDLPLAKEFE